jgi:N-acetylmuramoyl-L-alanine amidase
MKTIVLSAGHGGSDSGAVGNGLQEKTFNLWCVLACRDHLNENYSGHRLILPRDKDVFVSLPARRDMAANEKADLYVSCHANSFSTPSAHGFETFTHSGPLYQRTLDYQKEIHNTVYSYMRTLSIFDRGMKRYDHWVTRNMPCPTVLIEYFFVSNPQEAAFGKSAPHVKNMGIATAEGIARALDLPKKVVAPPSQPPKEVQAAQGGFYPHLESPRGCQHLVQVPICQDPVRDQWLRELSRAPQALARDHREAI